MPEHDLTTIVKAEPESQSAWDRWFRSIYPRVYLSLFRLTGGSPETAKDLTQGAIERFIRYKGLDRVSSDHDSTAYLVATGRRLYANELTSQLPESRSTWTKGIGQDDRREIDDLIDIETIIRQLDRDEQETMRFFLQGLSIKELSKSLGISYSAAGQRISRARKKMKDLVKKSGKSRFTGLEEGKNTDGRT